MKITFTHYIHDEDEDNYIAEKIFSSMSDDARSKYMSGSNDTTDAVMRLAEEIGTPFYKVKLICEYDTETNDVSVISVSI